MSRIYLIIIILTVVSCRKDIEPTELYFKFDIVGEQLLSEIKLHDTLKFAGSNGSNREYRVFKIEPVKQSVQDCSWNFGTCVTYYYFDFLKIYFKRTDTIPPPPNSPLTASLTKQMQLPFNVDKKNIPKGVQAKALVYGGLVDFNAIPSPGPVWTAPYITYPDYYQPLNFISYSNVVRTYSEVVVIKSGNNSVYFDPLYGSHIL
ncbi:MAG: hypothetical protein ABIP79_07690 [Chitinophagaceae bacterium]